MSEGLSPTQFNVSSDRPELAAHAQEVIAALQRDGLAVIPNASVYAIVGDANSPTVLHDIQLAKRDTCRCSLGWATSFEYAVPLVDSAAITDSTIRELALDPTELTDRFGGLGFIRLPARPEVMTDAHRHSGVLDAEKHTVQPYSPVGSDYMEAVIAEASRQGVDLVLSSANLHGDTEIVDVEQAQLFADRSSRPLRVIDAPSQPRQPDTKPLGSFPIVAVQEDHLEIVRGGCFTAELVMRCFDGYDIRLANAGTFQLSKFPERSFGVLDLPEQYRSLNGAELRLAVLATLNWQEAAHDTLQQRLSAFPAT